MWDYVNIIRDLISVKTTSVKMILHNMIEACFIPVRNAPATKYADPTRNITQSKNLFAREDKKLRTQGDNER